MALEQKQTVDDIADFLTGTPQPAPAEDVVADEEEHLEPEVEPVDDSPDGGDDQPLHSDGEVVEEEIDEAQAEDVVSSGVEQVDDQPYLDVTDDDLIEVKVDGEVVYRSIADAKKALSGEGAIENRLKEATVTRQQVDEKLTSGVRALEADREKVMDMVNQLDQHIFQPTVSMPTNELRASDPNAYLQHLDAYNADQARISQGRKQLAANMQEQQQQQAHAAQLLRQHNEVELVRKIPALGDSAQAPAIMNSIADVGRSYGFTDAEIGQFFDHRSYTMAHDLMQAKAEIARLRGTGRIVPKPVTENAPPAPRRLRSGVAQKQLISKQKAKARQAKYDRARETGKVDDVLATILKPDRR